MAAIITSTPSYAQQVDAAKKWVDSEFQPSTLSKDEQMAEMEWFIKASAPFKGMKLSTVSEILSIHDYESKTLTKAFADITGIKVNHELMDEGLLVDKIEVEIASGKPIYDFWMNDSDFIGTHPRYNDIVGGSLTDFMANDGKDVTNPDLDLKDFIGLSFATFTRRQALSASRSAIRQPLLVPLRLVPAAGAQGGVQGQIRLRSRRAGQLVGL